MGCPIMANSKFFIPNSSNFKAQDIQAENTKSLGCGLQSFSKAVKCLQSVSTPKIIQKTLLNVIVFSSYCWHAVNSKIKSHYVKLHVILKI